MNNNYSTIKFVRGSCKSAGFESLKTKHITLLLPVVLLPPSGCTDIHILKIKTNQFNNQNSFFSI